MLKLVVDNNEEVNLSEKETFKIRVDGKYASAIQTYNKIMEARTRMPETIENDEVSGKMSDFLKTVRDCNKDIEKARVSEKEPFLRAGKLIDEYFKDFSLNLETIYNKGNKTLSTYLLKKKQEEAKRLQDEAEAARKAAEEAIAAAKDEVDLNGAAKLEQQAVKHETLVNNSTAADLSRTRGEVSVSSVKTRKVIKIADRQTLDLEALRSYLSDEALQKALNAWFKDNPDKTLTGASIEEEVSATIR